MEFFRFLFWWLLGQISLVQSGVLTGCTSDRKYVHYLRHMHPLWSVAGIRLSSYRRHSSHDQAGYIAMYCGVTISSLKLECLHSRLECNPRDMTSHSKPADRCQANFYLNWQYYSLFRGVIIISQILNSGPRSMEILLPDSVTLKANSWVSKVLVVTVAIQSAQPCRKVATEEARRSGRLHCKWSEGEGHCRVTYTASL